MHGHATQASEPDRDIKAESASTAKPRAISFGRCLIFPAARTVTRDGRAIELGSRAFDLLITLLRSRGRIVPKDEIMQAVWPSICVEDSNLRVQMAALRRALGVEGRLIKTVSGRGYIAIPENTEEAAPSFYPVATGPEAARSENNRCISHLVGRMRPAYAKFGYMFLEINRP